MSVPIGSVLRSGWKDTHRAIRRFGKLKVRSVERYAVGWRNPDAYAFYSRMMSHPYDPEYLIQALSRHRALYVAISKVANTRIKQTLSRIENNGAGSVRVHGRRSSGLKGPRQLGVIPFYWLATDPRTLRFTFVRNPYDRLVSCWADKFQGRPLVGGRRMIDEYLHHKRWIDLPLPEGAHQTMSFADFVIYATEQVGTMTGGVNKHGELQSRIVAIPGIKLDFVGKLESFPNDMAIVLDHLKADEIIRRGSTARTSAISTSLATAVQCWAERSAASLSLR